MRKLLALTCVMFLAGCAVSGPIKQAKTSESEFSSAVFTGENTKILDPTPGETSYRVFHQGATGYVPTSAIRESAEKRATDFCKAKSRIVNIIEETSSVPPHIFGNFPRIELVFECLPKS